MKKILLMGLIIPAMCWALAGISCFDAPRDNMNDPKAENYAGFPIAYWDFEDVYPLPINGSTVFDKSGNGYDGIIFEANGGNPSQSGDVPAGLGHHYSINFLGGARVNLSDSTLFNFENTNSKFSVEMWVKLGNAPAGDASLVSKWGDTLFNRAGWTFGYTSSQTICLKISENGTFNTTTAVRIDSTGITKNVWHHIACTVDIEMDEFKIFIDGVEDGTLVPGFLSAIDDISLNTAMFTIGASYEDTDAASAYIDEVKLYDYIRTAKQISTDASGG